MIENGVISESSFGEIKGFSVLKCSTDVDYICFSKQDFFEGNFDNKSGNKDFSDCVSIGKSISLQPNKKTEINQFLCANSNKNS